MPKSPLRTAPRTKKPLTEVELVAMIISECPYPNPRLLAESWNENAFRPYWRKQARAFLRALRSGK